MALTPLRREQSFIAKELFPIAVAVSPDFAPDFAQLARFTVPVPGLTAVVEPLKEIEAWAQGMTSHGDTCQKVLHRALRLIVLISEHYQDEHADRQKLQTAAEQIVATVLKIADDVQKWMELPPGMPASTLSIVEGELAKHEESLNKTLEDLTMTVARQDSSSGMSNMVPSEDSNPTRNATLNIPGNQYPVHMTSHGPSSQRQGEDVVMNSDLRDSNLSGEWMEFITVVPEQLINAGSQQRTTKVPKQRTTKAPEQLGRYRIKAGSKHICGGFSDVWECEAMCSDGSIIAVAVKKLRAVQITPDADENSVTHKLLKRLNREARIWMTLSHPNIARLLGIVLVDHLGLISPWYRYGNVKQYVAQHPEADRIKLVLDVACGLAYLHHRTRPVVHGDLTPDNVLINEAGCAVIIDFGLSSITEDDPALNASFSAPSLQGVGKARWMAPELSMDHNTSRSSSTDVYSFGCVALYIYTDDIPFKDIRNGPGLLFAKLEGQKPIKKRDDHPILCAPDIEWFYKTLVSCWDVKSKSRPSMAIIEREIERHVQKEELAQYEQVHSIFALFETIAVPTIPGPPTIACQRGRIRVVAIGDHITYYVSRVPDGLGRIVLTTDVSKSLQVEYNPSLKARQALHIPGNQVQDYDLLEITWLPTGETRKAILCATNSESGNTSFEGYSQPVPDSWQISFRRTETSGAGILTLSVMSGKGKLHGRGYGPGSALWFFDDPQTRNALLFVLEPI